MNKRLDVPRYFLFVEAEIESFHEQSLGRWKFQLQSGDGAYRFEATDWEPNISLDRLEVLTVIRGLEELDQPAAVTVVSDSDYLNHGFDFGLREWRENDWKWERFGDFVPIANADLWRRLDRARDYHHVRCRRRLARALTGSCEPARIPPIQVAGRRTALRPVQRWFRNLSRIAASIVPI
jgi:ribonuclease HI